MRKQALLVTIFMLVTALALTGCAGLSAGQVNEPVEFVQTVTPGATVEGDQTPGAGATVTGEMTPGAMAQAIPPEVSQAQNEWPMANKDYANTRANMEAEINSENVNDLGVAWTFAIPGVGAYGAVASTPLIVSDTVYFQDLASNVFALDLETGEVVWQQMYDEQVVGPNGPALGYGKVFVHGGVSTVRALDQETGEELWEQELDRPTGAQQPYVFDGMLYTGTAAGAVQESAEGPAIRGYAGGATGIAFALDEETGEINWQFQVVEEGFWGNPQLNSGGGIWYPPAIDTESGLTYWGTGNPAPFPGTVDFPNGTSRPGPNLHTDSILAIDNQSGNLVWFNQVNPHDLFDHDFQVSPILATAEIDGEERQIVIGAGKLGRVIAFDRETGEIIWDTPVGEHQNDDLEGIPEGETVEVMPGVYGGVETPMAFADGVVYVPVVNLASPYTADAFGARDGTEAVQNAEGRTNLEEGTGELVAIDTTTGEILWSTEFDSVNFGAATVVNDLVFTSTFDGTMYALNREDGNVVWTMESPNGINAWPAVAGDTIIFPAGVGDNPMLIALRVGATGELPAAGAAVPGTMAPGTPGATVTGMVTPGTPGATVTGMMTPGTPVATVTGMVTPGTPGATGTVMPGTGTPAADVTPMGGQGFGIIPGAPSAGTPSPMAGMTGTPQAGTPQAGTPQAGATAGVIATPPPTLVMQATVPANANEVEVTETDGRIDMPDELPAGVTAFIVTNDGPSVHNFQIANEELNNVFAMDLQPGETRTMVVDLEPGVYRVWCPVDNHAALGMDRQLTVVPAEETTTPGAETPTTPGAAAPGATTPGAATPTTAQGATTPPAQGATTSPVY
jgi:outer membrane protein assembly factor BamB